MLFLLPSSPRSRASASRTPLRVAAAALTAALLTGLSAGPATAADPVAPGTTLSQSGVSFGAFTPVAQGGDLMESINVLEKKVSRRLDVVNLFKKWGGPSGRFENVLPELRTISSDGRVPMVTWEPMPATGTTNAYPVARIAAGDFDTYIRSWAVGIRDFGQPVHLRPMHEMNGNWYSWSGDPVNYVAAWRHIVGIFQAEGADNASFVWVANADDVPTTNTMESYWPGAAYVDAMGVDGYNCYWKWRSFEALFKRAYTRIAALDPTLPVWVAETGTCEPSSAVAESAGHTKGEWIREMFASTAFPRLKTVVWFDENNPSAFDWRVDTTPAALADLKTSLRAAAGWVAAPAPVRPAAPTGVSILADGQGVAEVRWDAATSYLAGYNLLVKHPAATAYGPTFSLDRTTTVYRVTGLTPGLSYKFVLQARTAVSLSLLSSPMYFEPPLQSLPYPRVTATATQTRANLKWAAVEGATAYDVYADGAYVATTTALTYQSPLLAPATPWSYEVVAVDGDTRSAPSRKVSGVTTSATPGSVAVTLVDGQPLVSWAAVDGASGYRVVRDGVLAATVSAGSTSWLDLTAVPGMTYGYSVASYNANSQSGRLAAVNVTV